MDEAIFLSTVVTLDKLYIEPIEINWFHPGTQPGIRATEFNRKPAQNKNKTKPALSVTHAHACSRSTMKMQLLSESEYILQTWWKETNWNVHYLPVSNGQWRSISSLCTWVQRIGVHISKMGDFRTWRKPKGLEVTGRSKTNPAPFSRI